MLHRREIGFLPEVGCEHFDPTVIRCGNFLSQRLEESPTKWSNHFFDNLFNLEWELMKSPAGAFQWRAKGAAATQPDAQDPSKRHVPTMLTTDLSLRFDPVYEKISRRFYEAA